MKTALITGITGQDGSYLAELLLEKGYKVFGAMRRKSTLDYGNSTHLLGRVEFLYADCTDIVSLEKAIRISQPDEVYNLAAQSFVATSWEQPITTTEINAMGVLYLLEAIKSVKPDTRFYQASTSEMFGSAQEIPQNETTPFHPRSPYGIAKLFAHWITKNYRESYNMYACSGILFNHESERRGMEFVSRKITHAAANISLNKQNSLELGNLDAKRDWGHAADYVKAMWMMLQQEHADDFIIASGETHTVREFAKLAFSLVGINIVWKGKGIDEVGVNDRNGRTVIRVNPKLYRPAEIEILLGDPAKARKQLSWNNQISFDMLIRRMVENDLVIAQRDLI